MSSESSAASDPRSDETVVLVTHTHWDREWYLPAGRFRQRLVRLIDELLDEDRGAPFLLDGQAAVLEDYLAVRPERVDDLARRLQSGALEAGPWLVLADELIPGGEALVRNLFAGRRTLTRFGVAPPPVLYSPDAFGHPAALPVIASGFGLPVVIVWRGYGGRRWPAGDTAWWEAADGSRALLFHLPPDGYELGSNLPVSEVAATERWHRMRSELGPRSRTGLLLVQNGADHHARQLDHDAAVAALERAAAPIPLVRSSLGDFAARLLERAPRATLPTIRGELRDSYGYTWTLQGTFGTRAHQKRASGLVERLLVRDVEPWAALAARLRGRDHRAMTGAAWNALLLCHPHDTLCGCSIDAVARAMDARLEDARAQATGVRDDALRDLLGHDAASARTRRDEWRPLVIVRNRAARRRGGIAELELESFVADVGVGPGSAPPARLRQVNSPRILDGRVPLQLIATERRNRRIESPRHYPDNDLVEVRRVVAWLPDVPGYALEPLALTEGQRASAAPERTVSVSSDVLDNELLRVTLEDDRTISLTDLRAGRSIARFLALEDIGDRGDTYTHSPFGAARTVDSFLRARITHPGPLRGEIETRWRVLVPSAADRRLAGARARGAGFVDVRIRLTLDAGAPFLRLSIDGENGAPNHRLRVRLRTALADPSVLADAAFGLVERRPIAVAAEDRRAEQPPPTAPLHRYVSLYEGERGATLFSDGLAEYEAADDGSVYVTLVRAVGELSRNDLPERPGHAGWPEPTPGAQCIGPFAAELAVMPHRGRDAATVAEVERTADDVLLPLTGTTLRSALASYPTAGGVELHGESLAFSAMKESEDGEWIVLRCINLADAHVSGRWELPFAPNEARLARLDETPNEALEIGPANEIRFEAGAHAVVTVLVR